MVTAEWDICRRMLADERMLSAKGRARLRVSMKSKPPRKPRRAARSRLPRETVVAIWVAAHRGDCKQAVIAQQYGITDKLVSQIKTGSHYAKITMHLRGDMR